MAYNMELLYDWHRGLYDSVPKLTEEVEPLRSYFIKCKYGSDHPEVEHLEEYQLITDLMASRPVSKTPDSERQEHLRKGLKLMALLNLTNILKNFKTIDAYSPELLEEIQSSVDVSWLLSFESHCSEYQYKGIRLMILLRIISP